MGSGIAGDIVALINDFNPQLCALAMDREGRISGFEGMMTILYQIHI